MGVIIDSLCVSLKSAPKILSKFPEMYLLFL